MAERPSKDAVSKNVPSPEYVNVILDVLVHKKKLMSLRRELGDALFLHKSYLPR